MDWATRSLIAERICGAVCLLTVAASASYFSYDSHQTQIEVRSSIKLADKTIDKINDKNGTIPELDKLILSLKSISTHADMVIYHEDNNLDKYDENIERFASRIDSLSQSAIRTIDTANGTLAEATEAIAQAHADLGTLNQSIAGIQPVLGHADAVIADMDEILKQDASPLHDSLVHFSGMTASGDGILTDAKKIADKTTADYLRPTKWYMQPIKKGSEIFDIGAAIARHAP